MACAIGKVFERSFRTGEVDDIFGILKCLFHVGFDTDARGFAKKQSGVVADSRSVGDIKRAGEDGVVRAQDGLDQHAAHTAVGSCNCYFHFVH